MKLRFDPDLPHQRAAIDAVLGLLRGPSSTSPDAEPPDSTAADAPATTVVANRITLPPARRWANLHAVQRAAGLPCTPVTDALPQISIEMETGTGKTYVYLRTVLELARRHGLRKIVIVVPSVAVREGVLATLRSTREHFAALLPGLPYRFFAYDGNHLARVRAFACSSEVELMVLGLDAFNKSINLVRRPHDAFGGRAPLALLQATRPLLVLDEPQRMESARSRAALADLDPILTLRYSATHRRRHALVHRLTPRQAHVQGLVKRIEVAAPAAGIEDRATRIGAQLETTIALHLRRQAALRARGIKVLSLLLVERVADWDDDGLARREFRRRYRALAAAHADGALTSDPDEASAAYFAVQRKRGQVRAIDSRTGRSAADEEAYALIMRDKTRLLSLDERVGFVVSHSALREGWDNPNVFQICTLAPSRSTIKKRQEVGRGVRLCVDADGRRVHDPAIDVLVVVANDRYEDYVAGLQSEDAETVEPEAAAPVPRPVGEGTATRDATALAHDDAAPPWQTLDGPRLRAEAVALARAASDEPAEVGEHEALPWPRAIASLTDRLLDRRPPCLVSRATIAAVLVATDAATAATPSTEPTTSTVGWRRLERAETAILGALAAQLSPKAVARQDPCDP